MMEENKVVDTSVDVEDKDEEDSMTDEEIKARQELVNIALDKIRSFGLEWTIRTIDYIVNREGITFNQLRSAVFKNNKDEVAYDINRATRLIIQAGLVGANKIDKNNAEELENKAYEIVEEWRTSFGYVGTLHVLLINIMEKKHFFMGDQDLKVLELLSYQNLQVDLVNTQMALDLETKISQSRALL